MKRYPPYMTEDKRAMMFETLLEQWHNEIGNDPDRVEEECVNNVTDAITELFLQTREKLASATIEETALLKLQFGVSVYTLINLNLEDMGEADVNKEMEI